MPESYVTRRVGEAAPDFTLPDPDGHPVTLSSLRGSRVVLYFYAKDSSEGCSNQAHDFTALMPQFRRAGIAVVGVATGTLRTKANFRKKLGIPYPLLNDADGAAASRFGVWREKVLFGHRYMGMMRTTFVIDRDGRIERIWEHVEYRGHAAEVNGFLRGDPSGPVRARRTGIPNSPAARKK